MNRTVQMLLSTARNGVICMQYLQTYRMSLYKLLLANFDFLCQKLKEDGIEVLSNNQKRATEDDITRLFLLYHYGVDFNLREYSDPSLYNFVYYRARKKGVSVDNYLEHIGFPNNQPDYVHLKDNQKLSFRAIEALTGVPVTTIRRKYRKAKGETS
jgi:hypothetical protein